MRDNFISNYLSDDERFMLLAIEEAKKGEGFVHPNPLVGAVLVKDGVILAKGYHHHYGGLHAERDCLKNAMEASRSSFGATIYVTLEPCCHTGKQPPCTQALIEAGVKRVVIGSRDPNPLVDGKGVKQLLDAGIEVVQDILKDKCDALNYIFFHYIKSKLPYIAIKYAVTADGLTATSSGKSQWITNEKARKDVHVSRAFYSAIMTGINTVIVDNPMLTCRLDSKCADGKTHHQPVRIICDSHLRLPLECNLVKTAKDIPVIALCLENLNEDEKEKKVALEKNAVKVIQVKKSFDNHLDMEDVLKKIGAEGIDSIYVESGGKLSSSLLFNFPSKKPLADEIIVYIGAKVFGSKDVLHSPVLGKGIDEIKDALDLKLLSLESFDSDIKIRYEIKK
ncbi:MAG: bifunctional diaminohydroxyphosphoribosylaminopyrimidine deaminase/5-amino-6-(5-phosphoribosylamino)uracil reductase RibD [Treponema sp.]|nr:bifunctional diaminohydroxyphosphoribosylaminopyrimidine deaminase/5-amino-6-(5-phosphoribosylamino)uracil reductase RibD [Treponema sp.]